MEKNISIPFFKFRVSNGRIKGFWREGEKNFISLGVCSNLSHLSRIFNILRASLSTKFSRISQSSAKTRLDTHRDIKKIESTLICFHVSIFCALIFYIPD